MDYFVHESSYVDDNVKIGRETKIWHFCHVMSGAVIGESCSFGQNVNVGSGAIVGDRCRVQNNVSIYEGVEIGSDVFCGPSMVFTNDLAPRPKYSRGPQGYKKTIVEDGASIGANATIVCGNTLGKWSMVAAGAVVTRNVKPYALVAGVPARQIGWVCECGKRLDEKLHCECGRMYHATKEGIEETL